MNPFGLYAKSLDDEYFKYSHVRYHEFNKILYKFQFAVAMDIKYIYDLGKY